MKLLVIDDEPLIHKSIQFCLDEITLPQGETIEVSHAYNGTAMLQQLEAERFDAALVDIQMPGMDGLEAIRNAKQRWPDTEYYIMSGYSEFEYAREAVHLGVTDYLMKPLAPEDLEKVLLNVRKKQEAELERVRETFRTWLMGGLHRHEVDYLYCQDYHVGIVLMTYDAPTLRNTLWVPDFESLRGNMLSLPCMEGLLLLFFSAQPGTVYNCLNRFPRKGMPKGVTAYISAVHSDSASALAELRLLLDASPLRVFEGTGMRRDAVFLSHPDEKLSHRANHFIGLRDAWLSGNLQDFSSLLVKARRDLPELNPKQLGALADFLSAWLERKVEPSGVSDVLNRAEETLLGQNKSIDRIDAVVDYIDSHFCEELSIGDLAARFDFSPNYLSSLLKARKNIKFTDYLTSLRLREAKRLLLSTNLSVKEISEQVGYHSQSHFTKLFLENEHYTPAEFKRQASGSSSKE